MRLRSRELKESARSIIISWRTEKRKYW